MASTKRTSPAKSKAPRSLAATKAPRATRKAPPTVAAKATKPGKVASSGAPMIPKSSPAAVTRLERVTEGRPDLRRGKMFGCEAVFRGKRAVVAVFGDALVLTLPDAQVEALVATPGYQRFMPGGRVMRGWVMLDPRRADALLPQGSLLDDGIAYAEAKDAARAAAPPPRRRRA